MISILESALFYRYPVGIRFEIGPSTVKTVTEEYFEVARDRAVSLFESAFHEEDSLEFVLQRFSSGRNKISPTHPMLALCSKAKLSDTVFTRRRDIYTHNLQNREQHWCRATTTVRKADISWPSIFDLILRMDFGSGFSGECFIRNRSHTIAYHLYDDRGLDLVAVNKALLLPVWKRHHAWALQHDLKRMTEVFGREM